MNYVLRFLSTCLLTIACGLLHGQTDKVEADNMIDELLAAEQTVRNWHAPIVIREKDLQPTNEYGIWKTKGRNFQIKSLRSDFYVIKNEDGSYTPVFDIRWPVESLVNLLLNRVVDNTHVLELTHHLYGHKKKQFRIPMQLLYDLWGEHMDLYCNVTSIDREHARAVLVFHQRRLDFIHLLDIDIPTSEIVKKKGVITANLYTNIPQYNVKNILKK